MYNLLYFIVKMNKSTILFSLKKQFNGNKKDWPRFNREFNDIVNAYKESKFIIKQIN